MKSKSISYLIETELEKAQVILAARSITDKLQSIAEQLAKMDANEVMPLGDTMRDIFGAELSQSFEKNVSEALRGLTEQMRDAKNKIGEQIDSLETGEISDLSSEDDLFSDDSTTDEEVDSVTDEDSDPVEGTDSESPNDIDMSKDIEDLFSDDKRESSAAGRIRKESFNSDNILAKEFKKKLNEGLSTSSAVKSLSKKYAMNMEEIAEILSNGIKRI